MRTSRRAFLLDAAAAGVAGAGGLIALASGCAPAARGTRARPSPDAAPPVLVVLAVADLHSSHERHAQLLAHVDRTLAAHRGVPALIAVNGDLFERGNVVALRDEGALDLALVAELARRAPVVFNLGNHEGALFDVADAARRLERAGATVVTSIGDRRTGAPMAPARATVRAGGLRVGVVGVATSDLATYRAAVREPLVVPDSTSALLGALHAIRPPDDADVVLLLSHDGVVHDRETLARLDDGAMLIGAHDHLRFAHRAGRSLYVHPGAWGSALSVLVARRAPTGIDWSHEPVSIALDGPRDAAFASRVARVRARWLEAADLTVVGRTIRSYEPREAAALAVEAVREAAGVDVALVGNTTFGAGLPRGPVTRFDLDAVVRFDGPVLRADVDGATLRAILARCDQYDDVPLAARTGEFLVSARAAHVTEAAIDDARTYRVATNAWTVTSAANARRYLGTDALAFAAVEGLALKPIVAARLAAGA